MKSSKETWSNTHTKTMYLSTLLLAIISWNFSIIAHSYCSPPKFTVVRRSKTDILLSQWISSPQWSSSPAIKAFQYQYPHFKKWNTCLGEQGIIVCRKITVKKFISRNFTCPFFFTRVRYCPYPWYPRSFGIKQWTHPCPWLGRKKFVLHGHGQLVHCFIPKDLGYHWYGQ